MDGPDRITFLGTRCPKDFRLHTLTLDPRGTIDYRPADWADALVVVERGALEVECRGGARAQFDAGAILAFAALAVRRLRNPSSKPLVLSILSRVRSAQRVDPQ
jgi:hypothetical protein